MKCESCKLSEVEIEEIVKESQIPFRFCFACRDRFYNVALRPLEFFNLSAVHGPGYYLHDDFYDCNTGEAIEPDMEVINAELFPFPEFEQIKNDLHGVIDFAFVQYVTEDRVIRQLKHFDKTQVLKRLIEKVEYNRAIKYKAFEIAGKVLGKAAGDWIRQQWSGRRENELLIFAEVITQCLESDEAFRIITAELESGDERFLNDHVSTLIYFQSDRVLDWFEMNINRVKNITPTWGQVASCSGFTWNRANEWLTIGRPLSLVALDSLFFCTSQDESVARLFSSRQVIPKLLEVPKPGIVAERLQNYLLSDSVPRTKKTVEDIIANLSEIIT
jgi:hypothetical protein